MVGLVEDRDLHGVERERALLEQVLEAAGAGHDDVDAAAQGRDLLVRAHTAEDGGGAHAVHMCERGDDRIDLCRELAGGCEDQTSRTLRQVRGILLGAQASDHRDGEGERLAGARLAAAQDVAADEGVGKRVLLDGEGIDLAVGGECARDGSGNVQ